MPTTNFVAQVGLTYELKEVADSDGEVIASPVYDVDNTAVIQLNAAGFVTAGGTTIVGQSYTPLTNGTAKITAKGADSASDEVDAELDVTVSTVEVGTIEVAAGVP